MSAAIRCIAATTSTATASVNIAARPSITSGSGGDNGARKESESMTPIPPPDMGDMAMMFLLGCIAGVLLCLGLLIFGTGLGQYIYDCCAIGGLD